MTLPPLRAHWRRWTLWWRTRWLLVLKRWRQTRPQSWSVAADRTGGQGQWRHSQGRELRWRIWTWRLRPSAKEKVLPQEPQACGRRPSCIERLCLFLGENKKRCECQDCGLFCLRNIGRAVQQDRYVELTGFLSRRRSGGRGCRRSGTFGGRRLERARRGR